MVFTPIPIGSLNWGGPVNAAFTSQDARITVLENNQTWSPMDQSITAWSFDPYITMGNTALATGVLHMGRLEIHNTPTVDTVIVGVNTVGSGLTAGQSLVGLYDSAGTLIGQTADQSVDWAANVGAKAIPLTAPVALTAGAYYVGMMSNGATPPAMFRGAVATVAGLFNLNLTAANARAAITGAGLTALPASITMASRTTNTVAWWVGLQ